MAQSDNCIFESLNLSEINLFLFSGCQVEDGENTGRVLGHRCGGFSQELPLWCDGLLNLVTSNKQQEEGIPKEKIFAKNTRLCSI